MMSNDEFRCDCVEMTRTIRNKLNKKFATMKRGELSEYLKKSHIEFTEYIDSVRAKEGIVL